MCVTFIESRDTSWVYYRNVSISEITEDKYSSYPIPVSTARIWTQESWTPICSMFRHGQTSESMWGSSNSRLHSVTFSQGSWSCILKFTVNLHTANWTIKRQERAKEGASVVCILTFSSCLIFSKAFCLVYTYYLERISWYKPFYRDLCLETHIHNY